MGQRETLAAVRDKYPQYADMSDAALGAALAAKYPEYADLAPATATTAPSEKAMARPSPQELMAQGIIGSGAGTQPVVTAKQLVAPGALLLRVAPGLIPNPFIAAPASAAGEALAQMAEQAGGTREGFDPTQIAIAGAVPPAVAGAVRVGRALARTATRAVPSLFGRAQEAARGAAEEIGATLTPETTATQLFKAGRGTGETIPAGRLTAILDDLDATIPKEPTNAGLQQVRAFMDKLRGAVREASPGAYAKNAPVELDELMKLRLDLGREIARPGSAPELRALYGHGGKGAKGIIGALEEGAEQGGAGAALAREALGVFKRDLGVLRWKELVEQATRRTSISGVDTPAINIAKLGNLVAKNADELRDQLGPEGLELIRGYLTRFRSLPPTHAATAASALLALMSGAGAGLTTGSIPVAMGAVLSPEIARNIFAVGRNPALVNQVMSGIAQATRAAIPFNPPRVLMSTSEQFRTPFATTGPAGP